MKLRTRPRDYLVSCGLVAAAYAILFQVMAHTGLIEKAMAANFTWWELVLIVLFLVSRLAVYLLVPPVLLAVGVYSLARRVMTKS